MDANKNRSMNKDETIVILRQENKALRRTIECQERTRRDLARCIDYYAQKTSMLELELSNRGIEQSVMSDCNDVPKWLCIDVG